jgi:poly(hydroxyalkanoate) depolymerase family esterase
MPVTAPSSTRSGGQFIDGVYSNAAGTRSYKLYIPSGYRGQALPLVVMLHGCTQTSDTFATGTRMNVLAERETLLVAYPEQVSSANGSRCWNWFQPTHQSRDEGEPSIIAGITRQIMNAYSVDASRVYVAGLSAGGAMAAILAATYPDLYAAIGVQSGLAYGAAHDLPSAFVAMKQGATQRAHPLATTIPMIVFHGDSDSTVAPANADCLLDQWFSTTSDRQTAARDMKVERGQAIGGHAYTRFLYHDTTGRVIAEKWIIHQAGHAWSGGSPNGSFTDPKGPDASAEMLRFFREHSR